MTKLRERDPILAVNIQAAIDAGKDIQESEPRRGRRRKPRVYRKTVRFSDEEALAVALDALEAHFVEQPLFANSTLADFRSAAVANFPERQSSFSKTGHSREGENKAIEIEVQTETQILQSDQETLRLEPVPVEQIEGQRRNLHRLRELLLSSQAQAHGDSR